MRRVFSYDASMQTPLTAIDASFLALDGRTTPQVIAALGQCSGTPDPVSVRAALAAAVSRFPQLKRVLIRSGVPSWNEDRSFSLDNHLEDLSVTSCRPDDPTLRLLIGQLLTAPLDSAHPPWRVSVIREADSGNELRSPHRAFFLFRFHHALADGQAGLAIISSFTEQIKSDPSGARPEIAHRTLRERVAKELNHLADEAAPPFRIRREIFKQRPNDALNVRNSPNRLIALTTFDLYAVRRLKFALRVSYNDVILAIVAAGIAEFLANRGRSLAPLRIIVPVSVRELDSRDELGNHLTGVVVELPIEEMPFDARVRTIHQRAVSLKQSHAAESYQRLAALNAKLPLFAQRIVDRFFAKKTNFICTNIPYAARSRSFGGATLEALYGFPALMHHHGIGLSFISYAGKVCTSVLADRAFEADAEEICRAIERAANQVLGLNAKPSDPRVGRVAL